MTGPKCSPLFYIASLYRKNMTSNVRVGYHKQQKIRYQRKHLKPNVQLICLCLILANFSYPSDESDRIWKPFSNSTVNSIASSSVNVSNYNATNLKAPLQVLHTALNHSDRLDFQVELDQEDSDYRVFFNFLELNETVKFGQRVFDIYINHEKIKGNFDIWANGSNILWGFYLGW